MNTDNRRTHRAVSILAACLCIATAAAAAASEPEPWFEETAPAEAGMHPRRLTSLVKRLYDNPQENIHSVLVVKGDALVLEAYFPGADMKGAESLGTVAFGREDLHDLRGATKSVVAMLLGVAIEKRLVRGVDSRLADYFSGQEIPDLANKRSIRLSHALSMTAGLEWNEAISYSDPENDENLLNASLDPIAFVLGRPLESQPGDVFNYSGGLTQLLAAIVGKAGGAGIEAFAVEHLFTPLDIVEYEWRTNAAGQPDAAGGLRLRPYDLAKIAYLYLKRGRLNDRALASKRYLEESLQAATAANAPVGDRAALGFGYGYHWWLPSLLEHHRQLRTVMAWGNGGQIAAIFPNNDLVVVMTAGNYDSTDEEVYLLPLRLIAEYILPAAGLKNVELLFDEPDKRKRESDP